MDHLWLVSGWTGTGLWRVALAYDCRLPSSKGGATCLTELAGVFDHSCLYKEKKAPWNLEYTYKVECV